MCSVNNSPLSGLHVCKIGQKGGGGGRKEGGGGGWQVTLMSEFDSKYERCVSAHESFIFGISLNASLDGARTFISHHHTDLITWPYDS